MERLAFFGELILSTYYPDNNIGLICREDQICKLILKNEFKNISKKYTNKLF